MVAALPEKFTKPALAILALAVWCRIYSEGTDTVQACDNGAYTVMDRHGRRAGLWHAECGVRALSGAVAGRGTCVPSQLQLEIVESNFARALRT
jgi:hypothetical protein